MRCTIHATALISMIDNCRMVNGLQKVSNLMQSADLTSSSYRRRFLDKKSHQKSSEWRENNQTPSMGEMNPNLEVDLGILVSTHNYGKQDTRILNSFVCPENCTNEDLCACTIAYMNDAIDTVKNMSCPSVITTVCKNPDELKKCTPNSDYFVVASYQYCPMFECFDSSGIGFYNSDDNKEAYLMCMCEGYTSLCKKCEKAKESLPYCENFLSSYGEFCPDVVECCATETTLEGLTRCNNILCACNDSVVPPSNNSTVSEVNQESSSAVDSSEKFFDSASSRGGTSTFIRNCALVATYLFFGLGGFDIN